MLRELEVINRCLGGHAASLSILEPLMFARAGAPDGGWKILDVGCGGGDFSRALAARITRRGGQVRVVGLDLSAGSCRLAARQSVLAAQPSIPEAGRPWSTAAARPPAQPAESPWRPTRAPLMFVAGDGFRLPFADRSFHIAHCAMFFHHFDEDCIVALLSEMCRVSSLGVLMNDLHRHRLAHDGIRVLTGLFSRSRFIRHDASASVRRAFRRDDLEKLRRRLEWNDARIRWHWAFRWSLYKPLDGSSPHV